MCRLLTKSLHFLLFCLLAALALPVHADVAVDTESLELRFSDFGDLMSVRSCHPACNDPDAHTRNFSSYRGFVSMNRDSGLVFELDRRNGDNSVELIFTHLLSGEVRRWRIPHTGWSLGLEVSRTRDMAIASGEGFTPPDVPGFGGWLESLRYVVIEDNNISQYGLDENVDSFATSEGWSGYRNRFWAALIKPEQPVSVTLRTGENQSEAQLDLRVEGSGPYRYVIYAGPVEPDALQSSYPELESLMYSGLWSWLRWLCQGMFILLAVIQSLVPSWALAIVLMSLLVQLVMLPLNSMAERIQVEVQKTESRIAPRLDEIKQEYKGAEQAERILALYREEKVHPLYSLKSLAGVMVIIPVFIAAFNMLSENIWLSGESFLWISDLSLPDTFMSLPFTLPFLGGSLNLLPLVMIVFSIFASILRNRAEENVQLRSRNNRNLVLMSLVFFLLFYTFPAGMVLYWVVNNAFSLLTSIRRTALG